MGLWTLVAQEYLRYNMSMKLSKLVLLIFILGLFTPSTFAQRSLNRVFLSLEKQGITTNLARVNSSVPSVIERNVISAATVSPQVQIHNAHKIVTIFHTSDAHGSFYPRRGQGGYAALASVVKQGPTPSLLLDSGDFSQGGAETLVSKGLSAVTMMNAVHYDAVTVGNHEFDFGDDQAINNFKQAKFSILAANTEDIISPDLVHPYKIFDVNNMRVAVIGLANVKAASILAESDNVTTLLSKILAEIQKEQADVVVLLAHHALPNQRHIANIDIEKISEQFAGQIHIILGGHAHHIVQNEKRNGVLFVESGSDLQYVSKITVEKDELSGEIQASSELIPLVIEQTGEDEAVKALAESLSIPDMGTFLGATVVTFEEQSSIKSHFDSPINNWVADLIRTYSGAQIGLHDRRAIRDQLHQGNITERDLIKIYPFDDAIIQFPISGKLLQEFVEKQWENFAFSGLEITYVQDENETRQIASIKVGGVPIDPQKVYTLATTSYVAMGKNRTESKFSNIPQSSKQTVGDKTVRLLMREQLEMHSPIVPPTTGRIRQIQKIGL